MTASSVRDALDGGRAGIADVSMPRANEVHGRCRPDGIAGVCELLIRTFGADLIAMIGEDRRGTFVVHYLFAHRAANWFAQVSVSIESSRPELPSLASSYYRSSRFEREIRDMFGVVFAGHPDPRPLVKHAFWPGDYYPLRKDAATPPFRDQGQRFPFLPVGGEGVYEIPVGPVHAGVIEPGHFRFSVVGETVIDLKTRLYFTHKGTEKLFEGREPDAGVELAERISGDTSVGHALAYCQALEAAAGIEVPPRARYLRVLLLELERLYNHVGDFGAMANDTGFAVAHAHCSRAREQLLRLNKAVTGSRLLRGALIPGGLARDLDVPADLAETVARVVADFDETVTICLRNTLLVDRLEGTGTLDRERADDYGVLGYVARASGLDLDARRDHPFAAYPSLEFAVPVHTSGDVKARAAVRVDEVHESARLLAQVMRQLPAGPCRARPGSQPARGPAFGIVEGWRGRIVHWVEVGRDGRLQRVKIVDPSFFNWPALSHALEGNIVPDFPLCNKSFNQSYSGNDL